MQYFDICYFVYMIWPKLFKLWKLHPGVGSIMVVSALTCVLLDSLCDLKAVPMNMQCSLIRELMLYEFELNHYTVEATKKHLFDRWRCSCLLYSNQIVKKISLWLQEFKKSSNVSLGRKSWIPRPSHSPCHSPEWFVTFTTSANLMSSTRRVSGKLAIS